MSLDYFDDEFMEGIPSIAPDLMFVEERNPTALPVLISESKEEIKKEEKQIEEEVLTESIDDPDLESTIEIDSPDISKEVDSPVPLEIMKEEALKNEAIPIILTKEEKESLLNFIIDDHAYARPFPEISVKKEENAVVYSPVSSVLKLHPIDLPTKKKYKKRGQKNKVVNEDDVDVVTVDKPDDLLVKYDASRGRHVMNEVEAYLNSLWKDVEKDEEEKISRGSWSKEQARLFDTVHVAINNYQLAKLTYSQNSNEPVLRKLALEKATSRVRKAFGSVSWNSKLVVWLHGIMIDGLCSSFFLCYLEILQSLKRKVPSLFERIFLNDKFAREKEQTAGLSNLGATLRKSWEPAVGLHTKLTMEKFPTPPFLITIPCGPSVPHQSTKRNRFWNYQLMNMGKSVPISVPAYRTPEGYVVKHYLEHCISAVRTKTSEFTTRFPDRPIVLVGWNVGGLIAMKVALLDKVDAVVCLGFPCNHVKGDESQEYWDTFVKIGCPVLFVLGTHALTASIEKIDSLRQRMKVHTNLIIMESGDELLRLTKSHKRSLGMTQNMIDRLIQDQLYLFLRDVLFKPKHFAPQVKELQSPKKKKKKMNGVPADKEDNKKRKKSKQFQLITTSNEISSPFALSPLDVSVGGVQNDKVDSQAEGLLTTGSISTPIPVTQMQNESLLVATSMSNLTVVASESSAPSQNLQKTGQKRPSISKEKVVRKKAPKKTQKNSQNFTASLGNQRAGNLFGQRFSSSISNRTSSGQQQTATLQRLPSGTFVLSGTSGPVKLQNGNNIVYLQQLTSSGGTTQVIQTPLIANSNGTFSTVPLTSSHQQKSSSTMIPTSALFLASSLPASVTTTTVTSVLQSISSTTTEATNQVLTASLPPFQSSKSSLTTLQSQQQQQPISVPSLSETIEQGEVIVEEESKLTPNLSTDTSTNLPVSLANFILSLPSSSTGGLSPEASTKAQSLLQKLSEEDLKTLASVLGKYSPKSSASPSPVITPELGSPLQSPSPLSVSPSPTDSPQTLFSQNIKEPVSSKSKLVSMFEHQKASTSTTGSHPLHSSKKISHPLSLTQKVTTLQQDLNKIRTPRLKPPRISTGMTSNKINTATISATNKSLSSKTQKVPITITIPISRLPSNFQLSTSSSKTINVPALSAYLAQQKFVLSTGKSSNLDSRTVLLSPSNVKKMGGSIMVSTNSNKNPSVFTPNKTPQKGTPLKPSATITLHLPAQSTQKETLKKAASDVKMVGVLNQKTKSAQLASLPSFKPSNIPGSPLRLNSSTGESSPIQPRKLEESAASVVLGTPIEDAKSINIMNAAESTENDTFDESDIDFFVQPGSSIPTVTSQLQSTTISQATTIFNPVQKQIVTTSKIIRVPVSTANQKSPFSGKNNVEFPKAKLSENQLMNSARKVGVAFQQRNVEAKSFETKDSAAESTTLIEGGNKLRFEPLNTNSTRPNLSSVLSSMRETGKIVLDEHGQFRNTIVAKPTVVSSKTAAMIARTAFMTDTKLGAKSLSFSALSSNNKSNVMHKTVTPALFSGGKSTNNTSIITTPAATIRTATTSKILPVTMKSNDFIRMSTQVRVQQQNTAKPLTPKIIKKDPPKSEAKSKKKAAIVEKPEPKKEPPPYVTRSGRVLRTRFSFSDEMERKASPRKRRRASSTSKEESTQQELPVTSQTPVTPTTPLSNIGSSLDSLVEAAKLITTSNENVNKTLNTSEVVSTPTEEAQPISLPNIDSTTNIAATAMLELLSSSTTGIIKTTNDYVVPTAHLIESSQEAKATEFNEGNANDDLNFNFDNSIASKDLVDAEITTLQFIDEGNLKTEQLIQPVDDKKSSTIEVDTQSLNETKTEVKVGDELQQKQIIHGDKTVNSSIIQEKPEQNSEPTVTETFQGEE